MIDNILFYPIFLSQILLINFYFSKKLVDRAERIFKKYPPSKYPKLYPKLVKPEGKRHQSFNLINRIVLVLGLILLIAIGVWENSSEEQFPKVIPVLFGLLQFSPFILMEISCFKRFKQMREANSSTTRKAELQPRRLQDFVSPTLIGIAIFMYVASVLFDLYVHDFVIQWGHDTVQRAFILLMSNLFLIGIIIWNLRGKKLNPYQKNKDRFRQIKISVSSLVLLSITMSLYFAVVAAGDKFDIESFEPSIASLYFQLIAFISIGTMVQEASMEETDFEVYREDVSTT
ncbi:hypothetical protein [Aliikangiella coralliicola]|uniref:Uncharacterized protein n=1 Tax=Aliikangiella coralliicola TaxID=2592383 RepID=A0A545UJM1_9GAMM|nr:hypothetical protein [Aliikangiella coralliicola]TQV89657.1 hypothetical protein FLL46_01880 [Aliikangiella coralliicola]